MVGHIDETTQAVYCYIHHCIIGGGVPPSHREIGKACYLSNGSVIRHLDRLEAYGYITREPGIARGLRLTDKRMGCT